MSDDPRDLGKLLGRLDAEGHAMAEHPPSETLSAFQAGELPPAEQDLVREHVEACTFCRERLEDLEGFLAGQPEGPTVAAVADFEAEVDWRRLRERLPESGTEPAREWARVVDDRDLLLRSLRAFQTLAAMLGILLVGFVTLYIVRLQGTPEGLRAIPEQKLGFYTTRGNGHPEEIRVRLPVALRVLVDADYPRYRVEISEPGGKARYSSDDYSNVNIDRLILPLTEGSLTPGTYTVKLFGLRDGRRDPIASPVKLIVQP